jgi:hypothetical protein
MLNDTRLWTLALSASGGRRPFRASQRHGLKIHKADIRTVWKPRRELLGWPHWRTHTGFPSMMLMPVGEGVWMALVILNPAAL